MAMNQFDVPFSAVALAASTAKSVVGVQAPANIAIKLLEVHVSFDGAVSTAVPVLVEICRSTMATNGPGTNSTSVTPVKRDSGRDETIQSTAAKNWTTEPTVLTVMEAGYVGAFNGIYHYIAPFASPVVIPGAQGAVVRCTAPAIVNVSGHITCEE